MTGLVLYTLFVGLISDYTLVAAHVTLDFLGTGNALTLQCKGSNGLVDGTAIFDFYNAMDSPTSNNSSGENGLQFNITPTTEAIVTCRIGEDHSPAYAFAAIPTMLTDNPMEARTNNTYVFHDESSRKLTCPARLGLLHTRLDPYSMSWRTADMNGGGTTVIITPPTTLSSDKRELTIPITNSTDMEMYQCTLRLRRCNLTDNGIERCNSQTYYGPLMKLIVLERSTPGVRGVRPQGQMVLFNDTARFNCSASGTNVGIRWEILGVTYEVNTTATGITISETWNGNNSLNSIIEIRTAEINLTDVTEIRCIIYQELPPEATEQGLSPKDYSFFATLTLILPTTMSTTPVTMNSTTPSVTSVSQVPSTTGDSMLVIIISAVAAIVIFLILAATLTVLLILYLSRRHKKHYITTNTSEPSCVTMPPTRRSTRTPIYEELPPQLVVGTEHLPDAAHHQFFRQHAIQYDPSNPKADNFSHYGSDEPLYNHSGDGSDLSGLSGVSGYLPGTHHPMPTYSHDGGSSVVSEKEKDKFLIPPSIWDKKRLSDSTFSGSRHTQSTVLPSYNSEQHLYPHSHTEVCYRQSASQGNLSNDFRSQGQQYPPYSYSESHIPQSFPFDNLLPHGPHVSHSRTSSMSSTHSHSGYKNSNQSHVSPRRISDAALLTVMNCLMHNSNCRILDCPCKQIQERYEHLKASFVPLQQVRSPEHNQIQALSQSSSIDSESDIPDTSLKKANMRLQLNQPSDKLHPHYHMTLKSYVLRTGVKTATADHRRSRSLSDLTPIAEARETPTPVVGGAIKAGTPVLSGHILLSNENSSNGPTKQDLLNQTAVTPLSKPLPPLMSELSLSSDNIPILCLNDCLLQLKTPSPRKSLVQSLGSKHHYNKPSLKTVQETNISSETDDSNTSSRSDSPTEPEPVKSSQSDNEGSLVSSNNLSNSNHTHINSIKRGESSGYESFDGDINSITDARKLTNIVKSKPHVSYVPPNTSCNRSRSCSPFETETTVSGTITIQTTEC